MADKNEINDLNRIKLYTCGFSTTLVINRNVNLKLKMADTICRIKMQ